MMRKHLIFNIIGKILILEAAVLIFPLLVSIIYHEKFIFQLSFIITIVTLFIIGLLLNIKKAKNTKLRARDGFVIVAFAWIAMSLFGAVPFVICGDIHNYVDALFEITSGFTTTGASVITDLLEISHSMLFWRNLSHWLGGMGVLVLILAFIPESGDGSSVYILRAESPGPQVDKLVSKMKITSRILYLIYIGITLLEVIFLLLSPDKDIKLFESLCLALSTAGTGGFSVLPTSIITYSSYTQYVIGIFMLLYGTNFIIYYFILIGKWKDALKSEELHWYIGIVVVSVLVIFLNIKSLYGSLEEAFRFSFFQVSSIISTTGFITTDFSPVTGGGWPTLSKWIIVLLMFCGGCAGSTCGGVKLSRIVLLVKNAYNKIKKMISPRMVETVKYDESSVSEDLISSTQTFLIVYLLILAIVTLVISALNPLTDVITNLTSTISCLSNVGPALGMVGSYGDFSIFSPISKVIFSLVMIAGRLEIFPILILFSPSTWRKN